VRGRRGRKKKKTSVRGQLIYRQAKWKRSRLVLNPRHANILVVVKVLVNEVTQLASQRTKHRHVCLDVSTPKVCAGIYLQQDITR
jgi:Ni,Fe-hydrogenase III small subunit